MTAATLAIALLRLQGVAIEPGPAEVRARILAATILGAATKHGVSAIELATIQHHESNGNPYVIGRHGEVSRWQLLPATARLAGYEVHSLRALMQDPIAADIAAWYLAHVRDVCAKRGIKDPASYLSKYRGDRCRSSAYSKAILADIARVTAEPLTVPEAIADHYRKLDAHPRPER